jgi:transposase
MLSLPANVRIVLCTDAVDMRKSFDGLASMVRNAFAMQPLSGDLFVFLNAKRDLMKLLWWDTGGFCLLAKRLEQGRFRIPSPSADGKPLQVDRAMLSMIFDGIEISNVKRLKRFAPTL